MINFYQKILKLIKINFNIFKGNILNEFNEVKKNDGTPFKVFTPFWRHAEKFYLEKIPTKRKKNFKMFEKKYLILIIPLQKNKFIQIKIGLKSLRNIGYQVKKML